MPDLIYRVISLAGGIGYGFPEASLQTALAGPPLTAIITDAGSMDPGPAYLGGGMEYFDRIALTRDFTLAMRASRQVGCPVVFGSVGVAGGRKNVANMLEVVRPVLASGKFGPLKVAIIEADIDSDVVVQEYRDGKLTPLGAMADPTEDDIRNSVIVGQMGMHPIITALQAGADLVLAGRACDAALFAADIIRRGMDPGLAYHVGHVLECGALAADPPSGSDCLVAEIYDNDSAVFNAPNPERSVTKVSIAAHSLYEETHPQLQYYPEGTLTLEHTRYFDDGQGRPGIRDSVFVAADHLTIKLEGSVHRGKRMVSVVYCEGTDLAAIPPEVQVYGRNGTRVVPVTPPEREMGIFVETRSDNQTAATDLASMITHYMMHFGFPERKATAGNLAYPFSPNVFSFQREDGSYGGLVIAGTRDPIVQEHFDTVLDGVLDIIRRDFPETLEAATFAVTTPSAEHPAAVIRTVDTDAGRLLQRHQAEVKAVTDLVHVHPESVLDVPTPDAYEWTLFHLLHDEELIKEQLFDVQMFDVDAAVWTKSDLLRPQYFEVGRDDYTGDLDAETLSQIQDRPPNGQPTGSRSLSDMARVIRSKDAGVDAITFDVLFTTTADYQQALASNFFSRAAVSSFLKVPADQVIGVYRADNANAIKISLDRKAISGSFSDRDGFGAQQGAGPDPDLRDVGSVSGRDPVSVKLSTMADAPPSQGKDPQTASPTCPGRTPSSLRATSSASNSLC